MSHAAPLWPGIAVEDGVASRACCPAIDVLLYEPKKGVDARHEAGHDVEMTSPNNTLRTMQ
jgi:hypothetical protein